MISLWACILYSEFCSSPLDLLFRPLTMEAPTWSELPADILCSVLQLLEFQDILRSSTVCTAWNQAFSSLRRISVCPALQTPCLLYCTNATGQTALGIYSLSERREYTMPLPADPPVSNWIGSSHGWLVAMDDKSDLMLLNPITHDKVALPPAAAMENVKPILDDHGALHKYEMSYYYGAESKRPKDEPPYAFSLDEYGHVVYWKATLSSDPSTGGCSVMLIHQPYWQLSFAKVGDDHWTWLRADFSYKDCVYHDGLFYAMTGQGAIDSFDFNGPSVIQKRVLPKILDLNENCYILRAPWGGVLQIYRLLLFNDNAPDGESYISEIEVYKVDFVEQKRIKMTGIGQYALFIGRNTTSCFSVKDYPELLPNHIYFTDDPYDLIDWENDPRKIGVYNLENKTTSSVVYPELWMTWLPPIWLTPSLAKSRVSS